MSTIRDRPEPTGGRVLPVQDDGDVGAAASRLRFGGSSMETQGEVSGPRMRRAHPSDCLIWIAPRGRSDMSRARQDIIGAESTGLKPKLFDPLLSPYSEPQALRSLGASPPHSSTSPSSALPASSSRFRAVSRGTDRRQKGQLRSVG